ncbi:MAG: superoxide dismutase [Candidatus Magasanikbacteria bacterium]|nr:superoxide dismutase [Candidatus Magasanikbacteria bacterium]
MNYQPKQLPFSQTPPGISEKTLTIHHDKLYVGYVNKKNEIETKLIPLQTGGDVSSANQSYSELRALKDGETFAANGVYLHEWYFDVLGGDGVPTGALADALVAIHGSIENFLGYFAACGMAARGWSVLAFDTRDQQLKVFNCDAHNQGGVWGAIPLIVLDVYEHAYFLDYGSDRKAYIEAFLKQLNWTKANELYAAVSRA